MSTKGEQIFSKVQKQFSVLRSYSPLPSLYYATAMCKILLMGQFGLASYASVQEIEVPLLIGLPELMEKTVAIATAEYLRTLYFLLVFNHTYSNSLSSTLTYPVCLVYFTSFSHLYY